ncbi:MAG: hypothetical protein AB1746_02880 [Candidatus Zixiibacteriota bacterium]
MTVDEYKQIVESDPAISGPLYNTVRSIPADRSQGTYSLLGETAVIALLFPVVSYIIRNIGLPWLHEAKRFSELWRIKFDKWIDGLYDQKGIPPELAEKAGNALRRELEAVTEKDARKSWERFAELIKKSES